MCLPWRRVGTTLLPWGLSRCQWPGPLSPNELQCLTHDLLQRVVLESFDLEQSFLWQEPRQPQPFSLRRRPVQRERYDRLAGPRKRLENSISCGDYRLWLCPAVAATGLDDHNHQQNIGVVFLRSRGCKASCCCLCSEPSVFSESFHKVCKRVAEMVCSLFEKQKLQLRTSAIGFAAAAAAAPRDSTISEVPSPLPAPPRPGSTAKASSPMTVPPAAAAPSTTPAGEEWWILLSAAWLPFYKWGVPPGLEAVETKRVETKGSGVGGGRILLIEHMIRSRSMQSTVQGLGWRNGRAVRTTAPVDSRLL